MDTTLSPNTTQGLIPKTEEIQSIVGTFKSFHDCPLSPEPFTSNKEDKRTMVSPKFVHNSPEKLRLRERVKFVEADSQKKLFDTQRQLQRKAKQVVELKNIIEDLKSKELLQRFYKLLTRDRGIGLQGIPLTKNNASTIVPHG